MLLDSKLILSIFVNDLEVLNEPTRCGPNLYHPYAYHAQHRIAIAIAVGFSSMIVGFAMSGPVALEKLGWTTYQVVFNPSWTPLPLFMFIGCLIAQTRIGEDLFGAARLWLSRLPGGLIVSSIMGQAAMGAVLGGSPQTILAIGPIAMPELDRYKYDRKLSLGALVTGGVLGPLIPPAAP